MCGPLHPMPVARSVMVDDDFLVGDTVLLSTIDASPESAPLVSGPQIPTILSSQ